MKRLIAQVPAPMDFRINSASTFLPGFLMTHDEMIDKVNVINKFSTLLDT